MPRLFGKPLEFWPACITLAAVVVCLAMGGWQVKRLLWKQDLITRLETYARGEAKPLPAEAAVLPTLEFHRMALRGVFDHSKELYFGEHYLNKWGFRVLTPLTLPDGRIALVNRGWVPKEKREPATRQEGQVQGEVSFDAVIRIAGRRGLFTPENDATKNYWFWYDLPTMSATVGSVLPVVFDAVDVKWQGNLPMAGSANIELRNDHREYAATWFSLAIAVGVIFVVYHRQKASLPAA